MKYKVGDKVRVKTWEQMVDEYENGDMSVKMIHTPNYHFNESMKKICGTIQTVLFVSYDCYRLSGQPWGIVDEMLLPAEETNAEHYKDEIWKIVMSGNSLAKEKGVLKSCRDTLCSNCDFTNGSECRIRRKEWLNAPYENEKKVDWSKVAVDTKILVRDCDKDEWIKRYFAKYEGMIYAWSDGGTSWSRKSQTPWRYAKLADEE